MVMGLFEEDGVLRRTERAGLRAKYLKKASPR
jgi:hypothetical protein